MKKFSALRKSNHGLTMIEMSISLAIVGVGLLAIIGVMTPLLNTSRSAVDASEVAFAAQGYIEKDFGNNLEPDDIVKVPSVTTTNIDSSSFHAVACSSYLVATNAAGVSYETTGPDQRLLTTQIITFSFPRPPPGATNSVFQTYTFVTEVAATTNIVLK
jgi:prepilin-type N-terminal cleavage/methylation domain-containing protein